MKRNEDRLRDFWDNIKCTSIHIIGVPEDEETEKAPEKIFEEIIVENFSNMGKKIVNQVQEAQSPREEKPKEKGRNDANFSVHSLRSDLPLQSGQCGSFFSW